MPFGGETGINTELHFSKIRFNTTKMSIDLLYFCFKSILVGSTIFQHPIIKKISYAFK
jgi:hypothetical protein